MKNLLAEHFSEHQETALRDPLLFGDYRTALNPEVPRIYEDIQDYDAAKGLFEEVNVVYMHTVLITLFLSNCVYTGPIR